ncbi:MAG: hypothetical protein ACLPKB_06805 [Xanthobacteraceae bacterium]
MSLAEEVGIDGRTEALHSKAADFGFLPTELVKKCGRLIHARHQAVGYAALPDLLWDEQTRDFITTYKNLQALLKKASTTRSAKRANAAYLLIATVILSLEALASDFAGWGTRFPAAKRKAADMVADFFPGSRTRLMDIYLPPRDASTPGLLSSISPG